MVKQKVIAVRCDVCGADDAEEWFMTPPGQSRTAIDLCEEHAAPLWGTFSHAPKGGGAGGHQVKTLEQIEREKAAAKKAAARRARKSD